MSEKCQVCNISASIKHFGIVSCDACAAFFRRTIKEKKVYNCTGTRSCIIDRGLGYPLCRYCRLKKCMRVGMNTTQPPLTECCKNDSPISITTISNVQEDLFLDKLLKLRTSIEFNRRRIANIQNFNRGQINNVVEMARSIEYEEILVLKSYLEYTGIAGILEFFSYDILIKECLAAWIMLESTFVNLKFNDSKVIYYLDENYLLTDEDYMIRLYKTDTKLEDPGLAARHSMGQHLAKLEWIKHLQDKKIDMHEFSMIVLLIITNIVLTRFDECKYARVKLRPYINQIFKSLNIYYNQNPDRFATRMDAIMSLINHFQFVFKLRLEHWTMMKLNGRDFWNFFDRESVSI